MGRNSLILASAAFAIVAALAVVGVVWHNRFHAREAMLASGGASLAGDRGSKTASTKPGKLDITINLTPPDTDGSQSAAAEPTFSNFSGDIVTLAARPMLFVTGKVNVVTNDSNKVLQADYGRIRAYIAAHGLAAAGPPFAMTVQFDQEHNVWTYKAGIPLAAAPASPPSPDDGIALGETYAGTAARFVHIGDPSHAEPTYAKISDWMHAHGLTPGQPTWEEYTFDPATPVSQWHTNIYIPVG